MSAQHSPTPWRQYPNNGADDCIFDSDGFLIAQSRLDSEDRACEEAGHIVACVNACEGINPRMIPKLIEHMHHVCKNGTDKGARGTLAITVLSILGVNPEKGVSS